MHWGAVGGGTTVNCEYFVPKIFPAINFRVKLFSDKQPHTALLIIIMRIYFACLIFTQARLSENISSYAVARKPAGECINNGHGWAGSRAGYRVRRVVSYRLV